MGKQVVYDIVINNKGSVTLKNLSSDAEKAKGGVSALEGGVGKLRNAFLELAGAYAGLNFVKESLTAFTDERNELVKLGQVYKDNSANTALTLDQLKDIAEKQENLTGIHKEQTEQVEALLLGHKDLKIGIQDLIPVIEDFSKVTGHDSAEAATLFGRAIANPAHAMRILMQANVDLTEKERKRIEVLGKMNDTTKAQTLIFDLLKDKYAGVAAEMFDKNPEEQLALSFHQAQVELGKFEEELLVDLMPTIKSVIAEFRELTDWAERHKEGLETAAKVVGTLVVGYYALKTVLAINTTLTGLATIATGLFSTAKTIEVAGIDAEILALAAADGTLAEYAVGVAGATTATEGLTAVMDVNPIMLMVTAIAALTAGYIALTDGATNASQAIKGADIDPRTHMSFSDETKPDLAHFQAQDDFDKLNTIGDLQKQIAVEQARKDADIEKGNYGDLSMVDVDAMTNPKIANMLGGENLADLETMNTMLARDKYLLSQELSLKDKKPTASVGSGKDSGDLKSPDPNDLKGEKHTIITFNIKQFGAEAIVVNGPEEAGRKAGDNIFKAFLEAIRDGQTTADIN